jgi:hypothetical protein
MHVQRKRLQVGKHIQRQRNGGGFCLESGVQAINHALSGLHARLWSARTCSVSSRQPKLSRMAMCEYWNKHAGSSCRVRSAFLPPCKCKCKLNDREQVLRRSLHDRTTTGITPHRRPCCRRIPSTRRYCTAARSANDSDDHTTPR